jgi:hypothetical protein
VSFTENHRFEIRDDVMSVFGPDPIEDFERREATVPASSNCCPACLGPLSAITDSLSAFRSLAVFSHGLQDDARVLTTIISMEP